ncbi:MAG: YicC family protein [Lentisphaerae bacterium GWF2_45_14]|nr:MAG: YicC family protein [Lentisphaerae bacterium GWF2_45_14]
MRSMTGFGRGEASSPNGSLSLITEVSSVNRKQLEIRLSLPRELSEFEPLVRNIVSGAVSRGMINVSVRAVYSGGSVKSYSFNESLADMLLKKFESFQKKSGIPGALTISDLAAIEGIVEESTPELNQKETENILLSSLRSAIGYLILMREKEGAAMGKDLAEKLETLRNLVDEIEPIASEIPAKQLEKLTRRLKDSELPVEPNDERLLRELVIFSDRSDVSEEITRLRSHFIQFFDFISGVSQAPSGRSLDFLIQEMNRETTTLGNKALDTSVSPLIVKMKTELEKIREQVQNVE